MNIPLESRCIFQPARPEPPHVPRPALAESWGGFAAKEKTGVSKDISLTSQDLLRFGT